MLKTRTLVPPCASQFVRVGSVAVIQERDGSGEKSDLHHSVEKGVWQVSTLGSATFCVTLWSKMQELLDRANSERLVVGFISNADDFMVSSDDDEADSLCGETTEAPKESGLEIDHGKSRYARHERTEYGHITLLLQGDTCCTGTEANAWNSAAADEDDESLARGRLDEACEFAGHVEAITQLHLDTRPKAYDVEVSSEGFGRRCESRGSHFLTH